MNTQKTRFLFCCAELIALLLLAGSPVYAAKVKNVKPIANAGSDQTVGLEASVMLNGQNSTDSDGSIKRFVWQQTKGAKVKLNGAKAASASFITPKQLKKNQTADTLGFKLTVTDDKNKKSSDTVTVTILACERPKQVQNGACVVVCVSPQVLKNGVCTNPPLVCQAPKILKYGHCADPVVCVLPQVLENGVCITPPPACELPEVLQNGVCAVPTAPINLNDTGIQYCSDTQSSRVDCGLAAYPGQDAEFGRDVLNDSDADGKGGFSFSKLDAQGEVLDVSAQEWSCVKDNTTGLVWENKTADGGVHDYGKLFSHFCPSYDPMGKYGASDDAQGFVDEVNRQGWCGAHDWRLPTAQELQSIVDYGIDYPGPVIDEHFFSNTKNTHFWTGTAHIRKPGEAWAVYFDDGRIYEETRHKKLPVRLVRTAAPGVTE